MNPIFSIQKNKNIFVNILNILKIRHTESFSNRLFNEHPYKNTLYGLSKMLSDYRIENKGLRIVDKDKILPILETPFIAYTGNDFIIVYEKTNDQVNYFWNDKKISITTKEFLNLWSGVTLLVEANDNSIEPDFKAHRTQEFISDCKHILLTATSILFFGIIALASQIFYNLGFVISFIINSIGLYIGYLLILKQMKIQSNYADKICSLFIGHSDCNSILESDASKILSFSWSEIGIGYFISNILILLAFPSLTPFLSIINIFTLPFSFWSIWYQKYKAKQWCPLCILSQGVLWLLFMCNLTFGLIELPQFTFQSILLTGSLYAIPIFMINILVDYFSKAVQTDSVLQEINGLKANEAIFKTLLKEKPRHEISKSDSIIIWGNSEAKNMITVVTNPHCNPCAKMHLKLVELMEKTCNGYCIQYILSSFNNELEESSKLFVAMYQQMNRGEFLNFLEEWYRNGKSNRKEFYKSYPFQVDAMEIVQELEKHKHWMDKTKIRSTPTVLFNGYELPRQYKVVDLSFFSNIEI